MCIHYDRIHHQKPRTSYLKFMMRLSKKCCRLEHLRFRGKYRVAMNTAYRFMRATIAVDYVRSVNGHTHGKYCGGSRLVRYPIGWSDNYAICKPFSLWGSTIGCCVKHPWATRTRTAGITGLWAPTVSLYFDTSDVWVWVCVS